MCCWQRVLFLFLFQFLFLSFNSQFGLPPHRTKLPFQTLAYFFWKILKYFFLKQYLSCFLATHVTPRTDYTVDIYLAFSFLPHFKPATRVAATADNRLENEFSFCLLVRGKKQTDWHTNRQSHTHFQTESNEKNKMEQKMQIGRISLFTYLMKTVVSINRWLKACVVVSSLLQSLHCSHF